MRPFLLLPLFILGELSVRALGRLVKAARGSLAGCLALAMADSLAGQGPLKPADSDQRLGELAEAAWQFYQERLSTGAPAPADQRRRPLHPGIGPGTGVPAAVGRGGGSAVGRGSGHPGGSPGPGAAADMKNNKI